MDNKRIRDWLEGIQTESTSNTASKKRPLTPPMSATSTPSRKRQRRVLTTETDKDHRSEDSDINLVGETPRQARPRSILTASDTSSAQSGGSSPRKQLHNLRFAEEGVSTRNLNIQQAESILPLSLALLLHKISSTVKRRRGLLPASMRQEATSFFAGRLEADDWNDATLYDSSRDALGTTMPLRLVNKIAIYAGQCEDESYNESGWCQKVYIKILEAVTEDGPESFFTAIPCSTASILPRYRLPATPSRMIDYVLAINPPDRVRMRNLVRDLYGQSINHTEFLALCERPIVISIEVKRTTDAADKAKLQLAIWLAAQWKMLQGVSYQLPEFLLAIWIQGHNWSLVVSTRQEQGTIIWTKLDFGDTSSCLGIYQIEWTLRYLLVYIRDTYWPWFDQNCRRTK